MIDSLLGKIVEPQYSGNGVSDEEADSEEDESDFSGKRPKKRPKAWKLKGDLTEDGAAEDSTLLRISTRSGKATNYNEDDQYLGMLTESDDDMMPAYANQQTQLIEGQCFTGYTSLPLLASFDVSTVHPMAEEGDAIDAVLDHMRAGDLS